MVEKRRVAQAVCLAAVLASTGMVGAQQPAKPPAGEGSAMERAQRLANNPLRLILEAARIRRNGNAEGADGADGGSVRRVAARTGGGADGVTRDDAPARAAGPAPAPGAAEGADGADDIRVIATMPAELPAAAAPAAAGLTALGTVTSPANSTLSPLPVASRPSDPPDYKPRVLSMVEPNVPQPILDTLLRTEVPVEMLVRADGSVTGVTLLPPAPRGLQRYIVDALERWRFEPMWADRTHRVVLVIGSR